MRSSIGGCVSIHLPRTVEPRPRDRAARYTAPGQARRASGCRVPLRSSPTPSAVPSDHACTAPPTRRPTARVDVTTRHATATRLARRRSERSLQGPRCTMRKAPTTNLALPRGPLSRPITALENRTKNVAATTIAPATYTATRSTPRVPIADVSELVGDHPAQLAAVQHAEQPAGHDHRPVAAPIGHRVGVARRIVEDEHLGHRHPRRDRHLLDDVAQLGGLRPVSSARTMADDEPPASPPHSDNQIRRDEHTSDRQRRRCSSGTSFRRRTGSCRSRRCASRSPES